MRIRAPFPFVITLFFAIAGIQACGGGEDSPDPGGDVDAPGHTDGDVDNGMDSESGPETVECILDDDCEQHGQICVNAECVTGCRMDEDCDDDNICTINLCRNSVCEAVPDDFELPDDTPGDCRRPVCAAGRIVEIADPSDLPERSGDTFCVEPRCQGTTPVQFPNDDLCRGDDPIDAGNRCVIGVGCVVPDELPAWVCDPVDPGYMAEEICGDGQDNNGDGRADGGCPCEFGTVQRCFTGPPAARGVGRCTDGVQQCINRANPSWGPCVGGILPGAESCNGRDDACNGCIDDLPDCTGVLSCPDNQLTQPFRDYVLDASSFIDPSVRSVEWNVIPPANSNAGMPADPGAIQTTMFMDVSGDYLISLTVVDDKNDRFGCSWIVSAQGSGLRGELVWNTFGSVDLDFHMHRAGTTTGFCSSDDCYYANCRATRSTTGVQWGYETSPGDACGRGAGETCPNPRLDIDNIRGFDPENINLDNPNDGDTFRFMVHKFSGEAATRPVVSIYCGGLLTAVVGQAPDTVTLTRAGGSCAGETWRVADVTMHVDENTGNTSCSVEVLQGPGGGFDVRLNDSSY